MIRPSFRKRRAEARAIPQVLLLIEASTAYGRAILEGVGRYVHEHGPWSIYFEERGQEDPPPRWIGNWRGDGVISRTATPAVDRWLKAMRLPTVELLGDRAVSLAKVHGDNRAGGRLAAEHLLSGGLRHFAFFSFGDAWWIDALREGFREVLSAAEHSLHVYQQASRGKGLVPHWKHSQQSRVIGWLRALPQPVGIFSPSNSDARYVMNVCREIGFAVPEQVAVLGADEDPAICSVSTPPLSSIDWDSARIGYQAAALLDRMMAGERPPREVLWIPPVRVVVRQSTDIVAIDDADVAQAVRFIREHAFQDIDVVDVAVSVGLSRRVLERRFRQYLGRTPKDEIMRVRVEQARFLLARTVMSVETIGRQSGFPCFRHFARIFRGQTGVTPRIFRQAYRVPPDA